MSHTEQMREAFERYMSDGGKFPKAVERSGDGYRLLQTQNAWDAWKACAAAIIAKTTTENTPKGMLSTTCPWCESGFAFEAPALTAPAAEVPEAMGDADRREWASVVHVAEWGVQGRIPVEVRTILAVNAQLQSTRLRGGVPEGFALVPLKPTEEMRSAGKKQVHGESGAMTKCDRMWKAMLTAAPQAPAPALDAGVVRDVETYKSRLFDAIKGDEILERALEMVNGTGRISPMQMSDLLDVASANKRDAERWRKFVSLDYKVRREWAANLSLTPVLTEWVDALPALSAAQAGNGGE